MPITSYSASGDNRYDDLTDLEKVSEQNRQRVEDNMLRMHMQDRAQGEAARIAAMQEEGQTNRLGMSLGSASDIARMTDAGNTARYGLYSDRAAADMNMEKLKGVNELERTNVTMRPATMAQERLEKERLFNERLQAPTAAKADYVSGIYGVLPKFTPGSVQFSPQEMQGLGKELITGRAPEKTRDQQVDDIIFNSLGQQLGRGEIDVNDFRNAVNKGRTLPVIGSGKESDTMFDAQPDGPSPTAARFKAGEEQKAFSVPDVQVKTNMLIDKITRTAGNWLGTSEKERGEIQARIDDLIKSAEIYGANKDAVMAHLQSIIEPKVPSNTWPMLRKILWGMPGVGSALAITSENLPFPNATRDVRRLVNLPE